MKRISFRLSRKLAEKFDLEAEKRGVTKASLLREWIDEFKFPDRINFDSGLERDFNLRLEDDDVLKL
ncbi:MAG TPA: ribbon-helix-helix protein, CopG family, partial [Candidatus Dojkabacteria bacterium]